jgi:hypothetical protein
MLSLGSNLAMIPLLELHARKGDWRLGLHRLAALLRQAGASVECVVREGESPADPAIDQRLALEARLYGTVHHGWLPKLPMVTEHGRNRSESPVMIGLSAGLEPVDLQLSLDGKAGISALARSLSDGRIPLIQWSTRSGALAASGVPAIERLDQLGLALDAVMARIATTLLMALDGRNAERASPMPWPASAGRTHHPVARAAGILGRKALQKLAPSRFRADHWRVAIRPRGHQPDFTEVADFGGFAWLPDDHARYYADPILWEDENRTFLLVEEFPYSTGRGKLSYTELADDGAPLHPPRPFLERAGHLSYPFLFKHNGDIYLSPENAHESLLPLYRARRFPDEWEELPPLILGHRVHDATLVAHGERYYLLANEERQGGSSWDCLSIFSADHPLGPYTAHPANPVLVDARYARSAGPVLRDGGRLIRPVQNCAAGYGAALAFAEITRLDETGFEQRILADIAPLHARGLHTYARSSRFEAIDLLTTRSWSRAPG